MNNREEQEQITVFEWARLQEPTYPELWLMYHIPNGGARSKATAARLKAAGVKAGIPDICLPAPHGGYAALYIELKTPEIKALGVQKGRPSKRQKDVIARLRAHGNCAVVSTDALTEELKRRDFLPVIVKQAIDAVPAAETCGGWISVKDRLPEIDEDVLMFFGTGIMAVGFRLDDAAWCAYSDGEYYSDCYTHPTHWMPLPEPPKEEV